MRVNRARQYLENAQNIIRTAYFVITNGRAYRSNSGTFTLLANASPVWSKATPNTLNRGWNSGTSIQCVALANSGNTVVFPGCTYDQWRNNKRKIASANKTNSHCDSYHFKSGCGYISWWKEFWCYMSQSAFNSIPWPPLFSQRQRQRWILCQLDRRRHTRIWNRGVADLTENSKS